MLQIMFKLLIFICLPFHFINTLRWNASGFSNNTETTISLKLTKSAPELDVSISEEIVIVKNIRSYSYPIIIYCFVVGYGENVGISFRFCKEKNCLIVVKEGVPKYIDSQYTFLKIEIESNFPGLKGLKVQLHLTDSDTDSSGNYHCEAFDSSGKFDIRSNNIQIRDTVFWEQNLVQNNEDSKIITKEDVTRSNLPRIFKCTENSLKLSDVKPLWINQEFFTPVLWVVCPVKNTNQPLTASEKMTFAKCVEYTVSKWTDQDHTLKPRELKEMDKWTYFVSSSGDLNIFHIKEESQFPDLSFALMCYTKKKSAAAPISTHLKQFTGQDINTGVVFNGFQSEYIGPLKAISNLYQSVDLYTRKTNKLDIIPQVAIYCLYTAPSTATTFWTYNGYPLNNGADRTVDKYKVNFVGDITSDMGGLYTLTVTVNERDKITMAINVTVRGPPTLTTKCLPLIRHVWEFDGTEFTCIYKDDPRDMLMKINKEDITFNSPNQGSQSTLGISYPNLIDLNFTATTKVVSNSVVATYAVYNLRKTIGHTKYQDHSFMFLAKNDYGMNVKSTSIYTVPRLKNLITVSPESKNCTVDCISTEKHNFKCQIKIEEYLNKELTIDHYWTISGHRLEQNWGLDNQFAPYFIVDPLTKDLTMLPIISNNTERDRFVKKSLKDNFIICNLDLISTIESMPRFIYYSRDDFSLGNILKAKITLDYQPPNMAYIYWAIAIILLLLILIIIIVLLTRYCMRNKGETYQLDKMERQHGYDPEKEVLEEIFKPYEREEHDVDVMSASTADRKLSITGHSVGSADDGELDVYDLDPSNFNEDGSIIGKYGANPRSRAAMT